MFNQYLHGVRGFAVAVLLALLVVWAIVHVEDAAVFIFEITGYGRSSEKAIRLGDKSYTRKDVHAHVAQLLDVEANHTPFVKWVTVEDKDGIKYASGGTGKLDDPRIAKLLDEQMQTIARLTGIKFQRVRMGVPVRISFFFVSDLVELTRFPNIVKTMKQAGESDTNFKARMARADITSTGVAGDYSGHKIMEQGYIQIGSEITDDYFYDDAKLRGLLMNTAYKTAVNGASPRVISREQTIMRQYRFTPPHIHPFDEALLKVVYSDAVPSGIERAKAAELITDQLMERLGR